MRYSPNEKSSWEMPLPGVTVFAVALGMFFFGFPYLSQSYLEGDEVSHFLVATRPTLAGLMEMSRIHAHPPLIFWLLRIWIACFGQSEIALRGLCFCFGIGALGVTWAWGKGRFGSTAAALGVMMLAASPAYLSFSATVRGYSLLVLLTVSFLYFRDRFFARPCGRTWCPFVLSSLLLSLSHYAALVVIGAIALVDLGKLFKGGDRRKWLGWMAAQGVLGVEFCWLYKTHLSVLRSGQMRADAVGGWLRPFFFWPKEQSLWTYLARSTGDWFGYVTNHPGVGAGVLGLFLLGLLVLWFIRRDRESFFLCLAPFVSYALAGIFHILPYGGTRHGIGWMPFAALPAAVALAWLLGGIFRPLPQRLRGICAVVPAMLSFFAVGYVARYEVPTIRLSGEKAGPAHMRAAVMKVRRILGAGELVATDFSTAREWNYYLGQEVRWGPGQMWVVPFGGGSILIDPEWKPDARAIFQRLPRIGQLLPRSDSLWLVIAGDFFGAEKDDRGVLRILPPDWILDSWSEGYVWALKLDLRRARGAGNSVAGLSGPG